MSRLSKYINTGFLLIVLLLVSTVNRPEPVFAQAAGPLDSNPPPYDGTPGTIINVITPATATANTPITLVYTGAGDLNITSIAYGAGGTLPEAITVTPDPAAFAGQILNVANATLDLSVTCDPTGTDPDTLFAVNPAIERDIVITHDGTNGPTTTFKIQCYVPTPELTVNPAHDSTIDIPNVTTANTGEATITFTEAGTAQITAQNGDLLNNPVVVPANSVSENSFVVTPNTPAGLLVLEAPGTGPNVDLAAGSATPFDIKILCNPNPGTLNVGDLGLNAGNNYTYTLNGTLQLNHPDQNFGGVPPNANPVQYTVNCGIRGVGEYTTNPSPVPTYVFPNPIPIGLSEDAPTIFTIVNNGPGPLVIDSLAFQSNPTNLPNSNYSVLSQPPLPLTLPPSGDGDNTFNVGVRCAPQTQTIPGGILEVMLDPNSVIPGAQTTYTYNVTCTGTTQTGIYYSEPTGVDLQSDLPTFPPNQFLDFGNVALDDADGVTRELLIRNDGNAQMQINSVEILTTNLLPGDKPNYYTVNNPTLNNVLQASKVNIPLGANDVARYPIVCMPQQADTGTASIRVTYTTSVTDEKYYRLTCTGVASGGGGTDPTYTSSPIPNSTINITTGTNQVLTVTNNTTGTGSFTINSAVLGNTTNFSFPETNGQRTVSPGTNGSVTYTLTCTNTTDATISTTLTINYTNAANSPATYNLNCLPVTANQNPAFSSTPSPGNTLSIATTLNTATTGSVSISNSGGGGTVRVESITYVNNTGSILTLTERPTNGDTLSAGVSRNITFSCTSTTAQTGSGTLTLRYSLSTAPTNIITATYTISCTVSASSGSSTNGTGTSGTSTTAPVTGTSVQPCTDGQVLSTPFPQNAAGEFLAVNCYIISAQGTVNVSLAQLLTNPYQDVTTDRQTIIQSNAGLMSVWRMGSWFLVPSSYNAATQTYSFESSPGSNIYVFFYGGITLPPGTQGDAFAGTTTGNVEDVIVDEADFPYAAVISTLLVLFVAAALISRRLNQGANMEDTTA